MFNLEEESLTFGGKTAPIVTWAVWFSTPFGLIEHLQEASARCLENDMKPNAVIAPVPVAIDAEGRYEIIMRG